MKKRVLVILALTCAALVSLGIGPPAPALAGHQVGRGVLGFSTHGHPIEAYRFGNGPIRLAFIGGIHGGYEWNTTLLAYEAIDFFTAHPDELPESISLYIVPSANPDGQAAVVGHAGRFSPDRIPSETESDSPPGRFNGNGVDLNRNWDADWEPKGFWGAREVSAGPAPFSEVETQILRDFLTDPPMAAVVFWHSAAPGVYPGGCATPLPQLEHLAAVYAEAAQYPFYESFDAYPVTGDASDWLCRQGVPAIVVELSDHTDPEWRQNLAGMWAVIDAFGAPGHVFYSPSPVQPRAPAVAPAGVLSPE